jgi:tetratricopeptide (TPR) repeat protein
MSDETSSGFRSNLQRGELLRGQGRYAEAEKFLQAAIGAEPGQAEGYFELAFNYCNWTGHGKKALATIDRAISLDPNHAEYYSLRAWILGNLDRHQESLRVAEQALNMNPYSLLALNAQTRTYVDLHEWAQAETSARRTMAIFTLNETAANLLAVALRQQGRLDESNAVTASLLAQVPDNAMAQSNAGWSALQAGDHRRANIHFMEALRLDPDYDYARLGLLHSFNSRVWIYRIYFQFVSWLGKHKDGMRYFWLIVIYLVYRVVIATIRTEMGSHDATYWIFVAVAFYLILFGFGRSFGNFFLLLDPFARHALTTKEKGWALFAATFYGIILGVEISGQAWTQVAILSAVPAFFLWGVFMPRLQDAFARKTSLAATPE